MREFDEIRKGGIVMAPMMMNVGKGDRWVRTVMGIALVGRGLAVWGGLGLVVVLIGLVPLATGLTGWCPVYAMLGINTLGLR